MKSLTMAALATAALFSAGTLCAQEEEGKPERKGTRHTPEKMIERLDTDKNGTLSLDEFTAGAVERAKRAFEKMDENKDDQLSKDELRPRRPHRPGKHHPAKPDEAGDDAA